MEPKNNVSDQQLDQWLREVEVPTQLKDHLKGIPDRPLVELADVELADVELADVELADVELRRTLAITRRPSHWRIWVVLAASVLIVIGVAVRFLPDENEQRLAKTLENTSEADHIGRASDQARVIPLPTVDSAELVAIEANLDQISLVLQQLEVERLRKQIDALNRQALCQIDATQTSSMIIALSDQTSIPLGGSADLVAKKMVEVMDLYPDSRGAEIAQQFLARHKSF